MTFFVRPIIRPQRIFAKMMGVGGEGAGVQNSCIPKWPMYHWMIIGSNVSFNVHFCHTIDNGTLSQWSFNDTLSQCTIELSLAQCTIQWSFRNLSEKYKKIKKYLEILYMLYFTQICVENEKFLHFFMTIAYHHWMQWYSWYNWVSLCQWSLTQYDTQWFHWVSLHSMIIEWYRWVNDHWMVPLSIIESMIINSIWYSMPWEP